MRETEGKVTKLYIAIHLSVIMLAVCKWSTLSHSDAITDICRY